MQGRFANAHTKCCYTLAKFSKLPLYHYTLAKFHTLPKLIIELQYGQTISFVPNFEYIGFIIHCKN